MTPEMRTARLHIASELGTDFTYFTPPNERYPGKIVTAGFFKEDWALGGK